MVLLLIFLRLLYDIFSKKEETKFSLETPKVLNFNWKVLEFIYSQEVFKLNPFLIISIAFLIGAIGGVYGIGGGALMSPILFTFFKISPYIYAGATLASTCITSIVGVIVFTLGGNQPDWFLGFLFGLGGALGLFIGAKIQKYLPQKFIRIIIALSVFFIGCKYVLSYFF